MRTLTRQQVYDLATLSGVLTYHRGVHRGNFPEVVAFAQLVTNALTGTETLVPYVDRFGGCFTPDEIAESTALWK